MPPAQFVSIVDDDIDITNLFYDALGTIPGLQIFKFTNPIIALEHFKTNQASYSLVISDLRMPEMNGLELLKEVKSLSPRLRTILVTAFEVNDKVFDDYKKNDIIDLVIQKPVRIRELIEHVNNSLNKIETAPLTKENPRKNIC